MSGPTPHNYLNSVPRLRDTGLQLAKEISDKAMAEDSLHDQRSYTNLSRATSPGSIPSAARPTAMAASPFNSDTLPLLPRPPPSTSARPQIPRTSIQQLQFGSPSTSPPPVEAQRNGPGAPMYAGAGPTLNGGMPPSMLFGGPGGMQGGAGMQSPGGLGGARGNGLTLEEAQAQYLRQTADAGLVAHSVPRQNPSSFANPFAANGSPHNPTHSQLPPPNASPLRPPGSLPPSIPQVSTSDPRERPKSAQAGPPGLAVRPMFTRVAALSPGVPFPSISTEDQVRIKGWMETDLAYEKRLLATQDVHRRKLQQMGEDISTRQDWLGGDLSRQSQSQRPKIRLENDRLRERERGKRGAFRKEVKLVKSELKAIAGRTEMLVPVRLEYEYEAYKLRDTFTWNLRETIVTPEVFASHLCEDLRLPIHPFYKEIVSQIKRHIEDARATEDYEAYLADDLDAVRENNRYWFQHDFKRRKVEGKAAESEMEVDESRQEVAMRLVDFEGMRGANEELRVVIKLDITLDSVQLVDKFEWDISDTRNSPEDFAETFAADLGLAGEFRTAIAHSIREQVDVVIKSLCLLGHVNGLTIADEELRREFLPPLHEPFRASAADFTPLLNQLTPDEVERNDKEREREVRRKRRQTKGRGVTLPDRDPVKTHRTLVPKPSTVVLTAYQDSRGETVFPLPEMSRPYPIVPPIVHAKPPDLDTVAASPLKLVPSKPTPSGPSPAETPRPGNRLFKKLVRGDNGSFSSMEGDTPSKGSEPESSTKGVRGSPSKAKKAALVQQGLAESLGLHQHNIDGAWFCANCGVPESCAVGRRKGPSGDKSLCGLCGKYYNRHRKQRPCTYTTDLATHQAESSSLKKTKPAAAPRAKKGARSDRGASTALDHPAEVVPSRESSEAPSGDEGGDDSDSSAPSEVVVRAGSRRLNKRAGSAEIPFIPSRDSDSDSSEEGATPPPATRSTSAFAPPRLVHAPPPPPPPPAPVVVLEPVVAPSFEAPMWVQIAAATLQSEQKDDKFEIIIKPRLADPLVPEWRIRCSDCPGKMYNLGPGETLDNFSVHFGNRVHKLNVEARLARG